MRVGLDLRILQESGAARGIATYVRGLASGFAQAGLDASVVRFRYREPPIGAGVPPERDSVLLRRRWREERVLADGLNQLLMPFDVRRGGVEVFHAPSPYDLAWWYPCPLVVTIHDMAPLSEPGGIVRTGLEHRWLYRFARRAARVIAVSEFGRGEILRHLPIAPERVVVISEAAQPGLAAVEAERVEEVLARLGVERPYLLHVGGYDRIEPRKDVGTLLTAFAELRAAGRDLRLVLTGAGGAGVPALEEAIARHGIAGHALRAGYVSSGDLAALYTGAAAFVFPSTYEGFGLPVLEAFACGAPVVAARAGALPEVGGDCALYVPVGDAPALAHTVAEVLDRPDLAADLAARGLARAGQFSWERTARLTWEVYRAACGAR